ncbi:MAG: hypothetical protein J2P57_01345 [Acidimicrobiaceae bacterium]|nr:hypothetical protein [Acidimicrobiaceae bacterium]
MSAKRYRVLFWGLGNVGTPALREVLRRPEYEVVGARVYSDEKAGQDLGVIADMDPVGVHATKDPEEAFAASADIVIMTPRSLHMDRIDDTVARFLTSGTNVLTTVSYQYPVIVRGPDATVRLERAALEGGATLHGTGVHPGFIFERLGMTLTGLFTRVDHVRVVEAFECGSLLSRGDAKYLQASGFGTDPRSLGPDSVVARWTNPYYVQVIGYAAKALYGAEPDQVRVENDVLGIPAAEDTDAFPRLRIRRGETLVVCLEHRGYIGEHHFFTNEEYWYPGLEHRYLGPKPPPFGPFAGTSNYVVEVDGAPAKVAMQLDLATNAGDDTPAISYCSAVPLVQSIVPVCEAAPGIMYPENSPHFSVDYRSLAKPL